MSHNRQQAYEVAWYRAYGRYPERIKLDGSGQPFVVGDQCWNQNNPDKIEYLESRLGSVAESDE